MARRSSFFVTLERAARAAARAQREAEAAQRRRARDQLRNERESLRLRQQHSKLERQQYLASREVETAKLNVELETQIVALQNILASRQNPQEDVVLASLMPPHDPPVLEISPELAKNLPQPARSAFISHVKPLAWWERLFRLQTRYAQDLAAAESAFSSALREHGEREAERGVKLAALRQRHEHHLQTYQSEYDQRRAEAQEFVEQLRAREPEAVKAYYDVILERSSYPDDFPQDYRTAYDPGARQLVIDYELPNVGIVPAIAEFRYVKSKDTIEEKPRKATELKELYRDVIAAVCLRCLHECFVADGSGVVAVLAFSGFVNTLDPATGSHVRPYVISVRVTRERFSEITLDRVNTKACLRNLGAQVSPQPAELVAVKPIIEFDMVDRRFIGEVDVLSEIESRPNLMDLTPAEFEALVGNLFTKMGLETKLTQTSRDGGVDAIAYDTRPILGGKVVIQAKRYRHTVGVSAVRDLYGTMMNEGANKGILVATSSYGPDAYDFCKDKPIELVNGAGLLYHLEQLGVRARIVFPDDHDASA